MFSLKTQLNLVTKQTFIQSVRYGLKYKRKEPFRKPIWQPIAPSKLYRIRKKEEMSEQEKKQREHLEYTYNVNIKSIKQFLHQEFYLPIVNAEQGGSNEFVHEEEELEKAMIENDRENQRVAAMREERLKLFQQELDAKMMAMKIQQEEEKRQIGEQFDQIVSQEIERSKTYITRDNIDAKIDEVLTHQTNYDYAIDVNGRIIFDGSLHPYALRPKAVPETSSQTDEYQSLDSKKPVYLKAKKLF
ncbi:mitochondrial ribosomal protein S26 [Dermatophagoides farinae]|uniref:Small ribosomal subunit protein mS26 n=1 Tax=Dermatophagoides farinae TaxID=6954 RepID=A0A922I778_DERFA|nr:probable 28S ribosomal protein S26, mitochondrial [Dermatophagoides farinae]KAH7640713.1 hypothetical protein HUG17_8182 [Dermatophagoides farinae]KAH9526261.1 hormone [Dermatophagoides farinae]